MLALATVASPARASVSGSSVVSYAQRYLGAPYVWGATGPKTFDCSGFTSFVYAHFGIALPRTSYDQMKTGNAVTGTLRQGDLLFWDDGGHVGIYTGDDSFVSATVHKGVAVYPLSVWRQTQTYTTARRIVGNVTSTPTPVKAKPKPKPKPKKKTAPKKKAKAKPKAKPRARRTGPGGAAPGAKIPVPKPEPTVGPGGAAPPS